MDDPCFATLVEIADAIRNRQVSSVEVTEACLARTAAIQPELNCFIRLDAELALESAKAADEALAAGGPRGPLHGVPLAHKDCFYRSGRVISCGTDMRAGFIPDYTATVLERLDRAGAIDLGGLNMSEWAFGPTGHNEFFGACHNPWNIDHVSGGSSSGSGAAVAARLVYGSLGTDTGGSVRLPSAMCGLTGLKPTVTRVSRHGLLPQCYSLEVAGPLARTAEDCARILNAIAGADPFDAHASTVPVPDYEAKLRTDLDGVRIGVPRAGFRDDVTQEVEACLDESLEVLRDLGAEIIDVTFPSIDELFRLGQIVMVSECAAVHGEQIRTNPSAYSDQVRRRIEPGFFIPAPRYLEALHLRAQFLSDVMEGAFARCDAVHAPVLPMPVPTIAETDVKGDSNMPDLIRSIIRCTMPVSYLGLPSLCVPAGFSDWGLPVAFQLIGRPFAEAGLLGIGHAFQQPTVWHQLAPAVGP